MVSNTHCSYNSQNIFEYSTDRKPPGVGRGRGREGPKGGMGRGIDDGAARGRGRGGSIGKMGGNKGKTSQIRT